MLVLHIIISVFADQFSVGYSFVTYSITILFLKLSIFRSRVLLAQIIVKIEAVRKLLFAQPICS